MCYCRCFYLCYSPPFIFVCYVCSHKAKVLYFLDKLCLFYEREYLLKISVESASSQKLIDKVLELAEEYGLSSKAYQSCLVESLDEELLKRLTKVCCFRSFSIMPGRILVHESSFFLRNSNDVNTMVLFTIFTQVAQFLSWELGLASDANAIISNGRVCKPISILLCFVFSYYLCTLSVSSNYIFMNLHHIQLYIW